MWKKAFRICIKNACNDGSVKRNAVRIRKTTKNGNQILKTQCIR